MRAEFLCFCVGSSIGTRGEVGWWFALLTVLRRWSRCWSYLLFFVVYSTRRFVLCLTLCHFILVFFSPFSIAITSLGEERANLSAFRTFVRFVLVWFHRFPLPLGVWKGLRFVIVALPGLFSYLFFFFFFFVCSLFLSVFSSSWCLGRAAVCDCGTPLTFLLPFVFQHVCINVYKILIRSH